MPSASSRNTSSAGRSSKTCASRAIHCEGVSRGEARPTGFEPVAFGSGGRRSIQLSYGRKQSVSREVVGQSSRQSLARPEGFEPPTYGFEARRSIQLSYGRTLDLSPANVHPDSFGGNLIIPIWSVGVQG